MVEIWSNHDELDTKTIKTEENSRTRGNNIPWISRHSSITSQTKVDEPPVEIAPAEDHIPDKFNDSLGDLSIASVNISENILEVIPKKYGDENLLDNLLAAEDEQDSCIEKLEDTQISLPHTAISQAKISDRVLREMDSGEIGIITYNTGLMESETTAVNKNSSYMDSESPRSFTSVPVPS
ncbi:hypothetical protein AgCh_031261 [Apium graveolens]